MGFAGNPRKYARDVADGYVSLTAALLRHWPVADLRSVRQALELELRDTRAAPAELADRPAVQARQRRLLRLNQALRVIQAFVNRRRIAL